MNEAQKEKTIGQLPEFIIFERKKMKYTFLHNFSMLRTE